jgi:hypothetical protein
MKGTHIMATNDSTNGRFVAALDLVDHMDESLAKAIAVLNVTRVALEGEASLPDAYALALWSVHDDLRDLRRFVTERQGIILPDRGAEAGAANG